MKKQLLYFSLLLMLFTISSCKKQDSEDWKFCNGCNNSTWVGEYEGTGSYYSLQQPENTTSVDVSVVITELSDTQLKILIKSPNKFYKSFTGQKKDNEYYFDMVGTEKSIHLNLYQKASEYKLTGTAKTLFTKNDTIYVDKSLSFKVFR